MADRYYVCRAYVKWKGKMYYNGDILPDTFTHHDKARSIYNSRIALVDTKAPAEIRAKLQLTKAIQPQVREIPEVKQVKLSDVAQEVKGAAATKPSVKASVKAVK